VGARLVLEPLRLEHADEMAPLLDDSRLHTLTGGRPATLDELRETYAQQVAGRSARWIGLTPTDTVHDGEVRWQG
jgi:hypothetical protein